jgi:biofilm PGA synthesis N-glycosyltransferase PgaC
MAPVPGYFHTATFPGSPIQDAEARYRFCVAFAAGSAWMALSAWIAAPWIEQLSGAFTPVGAWLVVIGVALAPGFMNAFQVATLLLTVRRSRSPGPLRYPPLTVLVPAYNEAAMIGETLRSLAQQSYPGKIEVIVIDDGSTDGTADVVRAQPDPRLRLLQAGRNLGKAAALNRGLALASHELIVTVDADSWLHRDALRLLAAAYLDGPSHMRAVAGAVFVTNGRASWVARLQYWDYFHGIAATKRVQAAYGAALVAQGAFSIYQRNMLLDIGGWPDSVGEDIVMTWAILKRGWSVGYAEDAICFTHVPETLGALRRQRARWARGLVEAFRHHPGLLVKRRLATFLVSWNLMFPWIDFTFTFGFIPGIVLALFGHYWLVGPATLALIPTALLLGCVMYHRSARVFAGHGLRIKRDLPALLGYTLGYGFIMHPASLSGYAAELLGARKNWGTK